MNERLWVLVAAQPDSQQPVHLTQVLLREKSRASAARQTPRCSVGKGGVQGHPPALCAAILARCGRGTLKVLLTDNCDFPTPCRKAAHD